MQLYKLIINCFQQCTYMSQKKFLSIIPRKADPCMTSISLDKKCWKPGTPLHLKWKPYIKVYVSVDHQLHKMLELLQNELFPQLEAFCRSGNISISFIRIVAEELDNYSLSEDIALDISLRQIQTSDIFVGLIGNTITTLSKSEVEYGFLNNPNARPSVFLFLEDQIHSTAPVGARKLKQRVRNSSTFTTIIDCTNVTRDVLTNLYTCITDILKTSYDVIEPLPDSSQELTFSNLSLSADMRMEYEQKDILNNILQDIPQSPVCVELTFENLKAYMSEKITVAPYLITAPTGSGKSVLLAKWVETLQKEYAEEVSVLYHFVTHSCSSSAESYLMYRRFCHKLMHLYDSDSNCASLAIDPDSMEEVFSEWLNKAAAVLEQSKMLFFVIDNAELLQDHSQLGWLHKPLPKNVRAVITVNESGQYPDSWKHLASCTLPTPTKTELRQQIIPNISFGSKKKKLSEDQTIELMIVSQDSILWSVLATRYILSLADKMSESEMVEVFSTLEETVDIPELAQLMVDELESQHPALSIAIEQILQLIYWSRNGLIVSELQQLLQFPDVIVCFVVEELKDRNILCEIAGILQFSHESVLELMQYKYHLDSLPEDLLIWPETLIRFFSDLKNQLLSRCVEELPWLLKRGEFQQDLANVLLNIDVLIQLYCSGQGGLLLKCWRWIGTIKDHIPEQYKVELSAVEDQACSDNSSLLYVAMVMLTVGKILRNLGLLDETQPLLQRALELYEGHSEPDSVKVADALSNLSINDIIYRRTYTQRENQYEAI